MAQYNLTNYWIEFRYTVDGFDHVQRFQTNSDQTTPEPDASLVNLIRKDGLNVTFDVFCEQWTLRLAPFFDATDATFDLFTLFYQPDEALEPTWITSQAPDTGWTAPSAAGSPNRGLQETFTFRAVNGKLFKVVLLETNSQPHIRMRPSDFIPAHLSLSGYVTDDVSPIMARSNAYILAPMGRTTTYNDRVVRKRFNVD